jgi:hypothetical protein
VASVPERVWRDDPTIPPPGRRTGAGSASILPYLARTLAAKPKACSQQVNEQRPRASEHQQEQEQDSRPH